MEKDNILGGLRERKIEDYYTLTKTVASLDPRSSAKEHTVPSTWLP